MPNPADNAGSRAELLRLLLKNAGRDAAEKIGKYPRTARGESSCAPASYSQQRVWFIDQLQGAAVAYHNSCALELHGVLDVSVLQAALNTIVARHETLRTRFTEEHGEILQVIEPHGHFVLQSVDLSDYPSQKNEVRRLSDEELRAPFDLSTGPLIRGRMLRLGERSHVLLVTMHHIVSDRWSMGVLIREVGALYEAYASALPNPLPALEIQYADYSQWQQESTHRARLQSQIDYWKRQLEGIPALLELPTDRPRPPLQSFRGDSVPIVLDAQLSADLKGLARRSNATLFMALYTGWTILLSRLSGQRDIVIGAPVANRRRDVEDLIGYFANTVALRTLVDDAVTVTDLLQRTKATVLAAFANQDASFEQVVEAVHPPRSLSHSPIFQAMLVLQNAPRSEMRLPQLTLEALDVPTVAEKFDLTLMLQEEGDRIVGALTFATDLFDRATIERWSAHLRTLLAAMARSPECEVGSLPMLSAEERTQLIGGFNSTHVERVPDQLLHRIFEEQVERSPNAVAVEYQGDSLTYAQLNHRANQLARHLRTLGAAPDRLVVVCMERSLEMVVALLGTLKAGAAYVPLDPEHPPERLLHAIRDAAPCAVLTQARLLPALPEAPVPALALDRDWNELETLPGTNLASLGLSDHHLAYVIYTSGSTGTPKGAMNEHRAVVNRLLWMQAEYRLDARDRVLQKTPYTFDVSVWEFFWPLLNGARLVVAKPRGHTDPGYLTDLIRSCGITVLHFVPSMLQAFLDHEDATGRDSLRHIVCSGEELPMALQSRCLGSIPHARLHNLYGPTEAAVDVTYWECRTDDASARVPIGKPIANTRIYILDARREPVPIGVTGDIYIGGIAVGRGYLNRPELTSERFSRDPFADRRDARLYRTGDLGRWRTDGNIEYLGRNDFQVKLRGFRIELGEIEAQIARHPNVREAVVLLREDTPGDQRLVAYFTCTPDVPSIEDLRAQLRSALPEYMVPAAFVRLESLPLTSNGKLDRRALPAPESNSFAASRYEAPRGALEETLAGLWSQLLNLERIGRHDNFFDLGGHSLLITRLIAQLHRLGLTTDVLSVFTSPTLAELAPHLRPKRNAGPDDPPLPLVKLQPAQIERIEQAVPGGAANIQDIIPLAPLQEGILFHHLLRQRGDTYILSSLLEFDTRQRLDHFVAILQSSVDRHDALRTAFLWQNLPQPVQVIYRRAELAVEELALDPAQDTLEQLRALADPRLLRMDLQRAPLIALKVAHDGAGNRWLMLLLTHHAIEDFASREIIAAEVHAHLNGRADTLPRPPPLRGFVAQMLDPGLQERSEQFFKTMLGDLCEPTLPFGLSDVHALGPDSREVRLQVEDSLARRVRRAARAAGAQPSVLFHVAWGLVVGRCSGQSDVVFGSVQSGRLLGVENMDQVVGMFINTMPVRARLADSARSAIAGMQSLLAQMTQYSHLPLSTVKKLSALPASAPLFTALLNYRRTRLERQELQWAGMRVLESRERTNYPFVMSIDDSGDGFVLTAQTHPTVDAQRVAEYLHAALLSLVEALETSAEQPVAELSILSASERVRVVEEFNASYTPQKYDGLVHQLFEAQAEAAPDAPALVCTDGSLTYGELNRKANRVARFLRDQGVTRGKIVALCMERTTDLIVGMLAILKAGAAYVPLDPAYPAERLQQIVMDAAPCAVLNKESLIERQDDGNLDVDMAPSDLAYVIYTSGSTGHPKGVMIEHRNLTSSTLSRAQVYGPADRFLLVSSVAFDSSVAGIFGTLCGGGTLCIASAPAMRDLSLLDQEIHRWRVTSLLCVPTVYQHLLEFHPENRLTRVIVAGEVCTPELVATSRSVAPHIELFNEYGPTETTVWASVYRCEGEPQDRIPIGRPIANTQIYILDEHRQPVPVGISGEIYIGGAGVARGYLNRPEATAQRFVTHPFHPESRVYRTGDLGRWRADGNIEYLGRNDHQIKLRGFRIEPGEIEAQLLRHPNVRQAVVVLREELPARLVAYLVCEPERQPTSEELRVHLASQLPDHMVPSAFVTLDALPLLPNGKLDRRALPAPEPSALSSHPYEAPLGPVEEALAAIWRQLLHVERVSRHDDFFELGGHSLLTPKLAERIQQELGVEIPIVEIFESRTLLALAQHLGADSEALEEGWV